jgi:hypothetical protein
LQAHALLIACTAHDPVLRGAFDHLTATLTIGHMPEQEAHYLEQLAKLFDKEATNYWRRGAAGAHGPADDDSGWGVSNTELAKQAAHVAQMASKVHDAIQADLLEPGPSKADVDSDGD